VLWWFFICVFVTGHFINFLLNGQLSLVQLVTQLSIEATSFDQQIRVNPQFVGGVINKANFYCSQVFAQNFCWITKVWIILKSFCCPGNLGTRPWATRVQFPPLKLEWKVLNCRGVVKLPPVSVISAIILSCNKQDDEKHLIIQNINWANYKRCIFLAETVHILCYIDPRNSVCQSVSWSVFTLVNYTANSLCFARKSVGKKAKQVSVTWERRYRELRLARAWEDDARATPGRLRVPCWHVSVKSFFAFFPTDFRARAVETARSLLVNRCLKINERETRLLWYAWCDNRTVFTDPILVSVNIPFPSLVSK